ncbi:MAG: hypothetical protein ACREJ5_08465 [Geminicoccaceae bacterium]
MLGCAPRFARLAEDGVEPKLAQSLAKHLADEIDRTVATKEHVEIVVTREVQQLRVETHEEFERRKCQGSGPLARTLGHWEAVEDTMLRRFDSFERGIPTSLDAHFRRTMTWGGLLYLAMLGNVLKDFLR